MRWLAAGILCLSVSAGMAADTPAPTVQPSVPSLCSDSPGAPPCQAPKKDLKAARRAFSRGLKHEQNKNLEQAFSEFEQAGSLVPQNVEYITARELVRQQLVGQHLERGNTNLRDGHEVEALGEFRLALSLDPQNEFAQQRLRDSLGPPPVRTAAAPQLVARTDAIQAEPKPGHHDFHYRGDSRGLITAIAASYGLTVVFDDTFNSRRVSFNIDDVDFPTAIHAASAVTKSFTIALENTVLFTCADTPENHRLYDRLGLRSFYIPGSNTPQELNDLVNSVRTIFDLRFVSLNNPSSTITVRGPQGALDAVTEYMESLDSSRPEVLLDIKAYQVSHTYTRSLGVHIPDVFKLFNIPVAALAALGGQNIQDLINQLIASGGINQAGNESLSALLAQLQGQQNSIFSQPLATFGGGLTFFGLSLDQLSATLSMNESSVKALQHVTLRAQQDKDATFKIGSRYPILNASFAPIYNNAAIAQVVGNNSYTAAFPSVSYEDIGLTMKAKPAVHANGEVALQLEIQMRSIGVASLNGVPVISNREYKGGIALMDGEPAVVAGMITQADQKSLSGLPMFSRIPGLGALASQRSKEEDDDEILIVVTPHVVRDTNHANPPEIWVSK